MKFNDGYRNSIVSILLACFGGTYFYTVGYCLAFGLPTEIDVMSSAYFFLKFMMTFLSSYSLLLIPIVTIYMLDMSKVDKWLEDYVYSRCYALEEPGKFIMQIVSPTTFLKVLIYGDYFFIFLLFTLFYFVDPLYLESKTLQLIFFLVSILSVFLPSLFFIMKSYEKEELDIVRTVSVFILSGILCFNIGFRLAPQLMQFPETEISSEKLSLGTVKVIWRNTNDIYVVKCKKFGTSKIKGIKSDEVFFESFVDDSKHRGVCN